MAFSREGEKVCGKEATQRQKKCGTCTDKRVKSNHSTNEPRLNWRKQVCTKEREEDDLEWKKTEGSEWERSEGREKRNLAKNKTFEMRNWD